MYIAFRRENSRPPQISTVYDLGFKGLGSILCVQFEDRKYKTMAVEPVAVRSTPDRCKDRDAGAVARPRARQNTRLGGRDNCRGFAAADG